MNHRSRRTIISPRLLGLFLSVAGFAGFERASSADQAADTTIAIVGKEAGPTAFIARLQMTINKPEALTKIGFRITPKDGALARPVSGTYSVSYLEERGYFN